MGRTSALALTALMLAQAGAAIAQDSAAPQAAATETDEIIVTAQRREQRTIDVPYNISAVTGADLAVAGASSANDLTKVVAGLGNFASGPADAFGENNFSLRGLRTDAAGPSFGIKYTVSSVSTYYGDVPVFFNLQLKDLERVEVLRGPQGTLYGSGAQAGAIRFIPKRPTFDAVKGEFNASTGITKSASALNGSADGVFNLPLASNLALRVSAAYNRQAGFIDQVNLFQLDSNGVPVPSVPGDLTSGPVIAPIRKNTNSWDQWMARGALRYKPTDWLDLELAYLHQNTNSDDMQVSNPDYQGGVGNLSIDQTAEPPAPSFANSDYQTRPGGRYSNTQSILQPVSAKLDLVSGTATFDLGFAEFSSITSYYSNKTRSHTDGGVIYVNPTVSFVGGYNHYPRFLADVGFDGGEKGFTQEMRLVSQGDSPLSYVLGAYYQRQKKSADYIFVVPGLYAFSSAPGCEGCFAGANPQLTDQVFTAEQRFTNKEQAVFGELSYKLTEQWQVTGGVRFFKVSQDFSTVSDYPFFGATPAPVILGTSQSDHVLKFNTSYELDGDNKIYATYAEGFRRGGVNPVPVTGPSASLPEFLSFKPDFANNYEVGIKGRILDRRLTYSLALFKIDQKGFQFNGLTPSFYTAVFNGDKATSKGIEFEATIRATPELSLGGSYSYTVTNVPNTTVIRDIDPNTGEVAVNPNATVLAGSILPGVSKHAANAMIDYEIGLGGDSKVILHTNASYRSKQNNLIAVNSPNFAEIPSVFMADARITYESGKGWSGSLFVTNLTNAFGSTGSQGAQTAAGQIEPSALLYAGKIVATPRTIGVSVHYGF